MKQYYSILVSSEILQRGQLHQWHGTSQQLEQTLCGLDLSVCRPRSRRSLAPQPWFGSRRVVLLGELRELWVTLCC